MSEKSTLSSRLFSTVAKFTGNVSAAQESDTETQVWEHPTDALYKMAPFKVVAAHARAVNVRSFFTSRKIGYCLESLYTRSSIFLRS